MHCRAAVQSCRKSGPEELQSLAQAMRRMAERVQQLVEKANLELSRRETIMACMAEGVLAVDKNLRVNFCNSAFAEAFSTRVPESEGRSLYEVVREPILARHSGTRRQNRQARTRSLSPAQCGRPLV